ncbi:hypothetical protein ABIE27_001242 [Paenibacillus sp. 4624]
MLAPLRRKLKLNADIDIRMVETGLRIARITVGSYLRENVPV